MALDKNKLKDNFVTWMEIPYVSKDEALSNFTDAYDLYAQDAEATTGGEFVSANKAGMLSILLTLPSVGTPSSASEIFCNAISAYWVGGVLSPSLVHSTFPPALLQSTMTSLFSVIDPEKTVEEYAEDFAEAIHEVTVTVQTILPVTPPVYGLIF